MGLIFGEILLNLCISLSLGEFATRLDFLGRWLGLNRDKIICIDLVHILVDLNYTYTPGLKPIPVGAHSDQGSFLAIR